MRPSALFLSPEAPYPATGGGSLRSAALLEYLACRYAVDLVVFREPGAPDPRDAVPAGIARRIDVIDLPYHSRTFFARAARNAVRYVAARPPLNDRFAGFDAPLSSLLTGRQYDLAVIEHFWCAPYCEQVQPHAARIVLDLHNVESVFYGRSARVEPWPASAALRRFERACRSLEREWIPRFSLVLATSPSDARLVREICPEAKTQVYPNTIPFTPQPDVAEEHVLVFSGNFEYQPNISAVRFFRNRIWPLLRDRWPGLVWRLVGKEPAGRCAPRFRRPAHRGGRPGCQCRRSARRRPCRRGSAARGQRHACKNFGGLGRRARRGFHLARSRRAARLPRRTGAAGRFA